MYKKKSIAFVLLVYFYFHILYVLPLAILRQSIQVTVCVLGLACSLGDNWIV